jgi:hypothetical protein
VAAILSAGSAELSAGTCDTCGASGCCPIAWLAPGTPECGAGSAALYSCVPAPAYDTHGWAPAESASLCKQTPGVGLWVVVVSCVLGTATVASLAALAIAWRRRAPQEAKKKVLR